MKKYSLLSLLLLINVQTAFSQITVSNRYKRFQYATIAKIVEVIDARAEKEEVGLIINQESKSIDTVRLDNNLNDYLLNWMERVAIPRDGGYKHSLALKVNYLEFNRRKSKNQTRYWLFYDLELFVKNPDSTYTPVYQAVETLEGVPYLNRENDPDDMLLTLLHWQFWNEFQKKISAIKFKNLLKQNKALTASEVYKPSTLDPVLTTDRLEPGSYETLTELINNKPSLPLFDEDRKDIIAKHIITIEKKDSTVTRYVPVSSLFGYCDGRNVFFNYNATGNFIAAERLGTIFEASGQATKVYNEARSLRIANAASSTIRDIFTSSVKPGTTGISAAALVIGLMAESYNPRFYFNTKTNGKLQEMDFVRIE